MRQPGNVGAYLLFNLLSPLNWLVRYTLFVLIFAHSGKKIDSRAKFSTEFTLKITAFRTFWSLWKKFVSKNKYARKLVFDRCAKINTREINRHPMREIKSARKLVRIRYLKNSRGWQILTFLRNRKINIKVLLMRWF